MTNRAWLPAVMITITFLIPIIGDAQSVGTVQGYKVKGPRIDLLATPPSAETISVDGVATTNAQPYFLTSLSAGLHTISVTKPQGWSVGYTLCYNDSSCHTQTPTSGDSVGVNVPAGGYADLWWHYTPLVIATGRIQGYKVKSPGYDTTQTPPSAETISLDGVAKTSSQPYVLDAPAGQHTISVSAPSGWVVSYTACPNDTSDTSCHTQTPTFGNSAIINVPANGYIDLWWHFTPAPGAVQGYKVDGSGNPVTTLNTAVLFYSGHLGGVMIGPEIEIPFGGNPYHTTLPGGAASAVATIPEGYSVSYSLCDNCTNHPATSYVAGNAVEVSVSPDRYVDLWWKYTPLPTQSSVKKLVESGLNGFAYGYAPTIVKKNGTYHMFFCTFVGKISPNSTDAIRYTTSSDGLHWSTPTIALLATGYSGQDLNACDPNVVFFNGYYYMYYSDTLYEPVGNARTIIQVARSQAIGGPYLTYTKRGTWEKTPNDPQVLIYPLVRTASGYGAGQQQVVVRNSKLYMWYNDDSLGTMKTYMLESSDPLQWTSSASRTIDIPVSDGYAHSPDIKFDPVHNVFVMVRIPNAHSATSSLSYLTSADGMHWSSEKSLLSEAEMPNWANNNGISGDEFGNLFSGQTLIAFAAPYQRDRATDTWGFWDLYGTFFDLISLVGPAPVSSTPTPQPISNPPPLQSIVSSNATSAITTKSADSNSQIKMLQNQVAELLNTFAALKAGTNQPTAPATCPNLVRNISRHSRGADVTSLQKFLIAQGLLTADSATGLFGSLTERAIQQWQKKAGIISAGSPGTTGYGAVGPKTRAALLKCH